MAVKTVTLFTFTFPADSTSDTLPITACPVCIKLFNAGDEAVRVERYVDGEYDRDDLYHPACAATLPEFKT